MVFVTLFSGPVVADDVICQPGFGVNEGSCQLCTRGYYSGGGTGVSCEECSAGTYTNTVGATSCKTCPAGKYSGSGASACQICPAGTYSLAGAASCTPCESGTYSDKGAASCEACLAGTYGDDNSGSCVECPAGTYSSEPGGHGLSSCLSCPLRTYSESGATSCETCPAGSCCARGIAYRCVKGTWSPGEELCQAISYEVTQVCQQQDKGVNNQNTGGISSGYQKGSNDRGETGSSTGNNNTGGGSSGGGGGGMCSIEDVSSYKNGYCLHECSGPCTTESVGAPSEEYCTVKTVKNFKYNNNKVFEWPKDGSVSEQSIKSTSGIHFSISRCPAS